MIQEYYKAPWRHEMSKNGGYFEIIDREGVLIGEVDFHDKYYRNFTRPLCTQRKAAEHAQMMAAAPEMLEALDACVQAMRIVCSHAIIPFIEKAEKAIKKAKGE